MGFCKPCATPLTLTLPAPLDFYPQIIYGTFFSLNNRPKDKPHQPRGHVGTKWRFCRAMEQKTAGLSTGQFEFVPGTSPVCAGNSSCVCRTPSRPKRYVCCFFLPEIIWKLVLASGKTSHPSGRHRDPLKTGGSHICHRILSFVATGSFGQETFHTGLWWCMVSFSQHPPNRMEVLTNRTHRNYKSI